MIDQQYPQVPPDIRAAWADSVNGLVQRVVQGGPGAAAAYANQERDATFSYPIPESGIPIPEEIFRQGRVVMYPPSLMMVGNPSGVLIVWIIAAAALAAVAKLITGVTCRRHLPAEVSP